MAIKIDIPADRLSHVYSGVFKSTKPVVGDEATLENGMVVVNMTAGTNNLTAADAYTFLVENFDNITSGVIAAVVYDCFLKGGGFIFVNGKKVFTKAEIEEQVESERES